MVDNILYDFGFLDDFDIIGCFNFGTCDSVNSELSLAWGFYCSRWSWLRSWSSVADNCNFSHWAWRLSWSHCLWTWGCFWTCCNWWCQICCARLCGDIKYIISSECCCCSDNLLYWRNWEWRNIVFADALWDDIGNFIAGVLLLWNDGFRSWSWFNKNGLKNF